MKWVFAAIFTLCFIEQMFLDEWRSPAWYDHSIEGLVALGVFCILAELKESK